MLNQENKCAQLVGDKNFKLPTISEMFSMQLELQKFYSKRGKGFDYENSNFLEKTKEILYQFNCLSSEMNELQERLPWKSWKSYSDSDVDAASSGDELLETKFEYIDMFHFFMNIGLLLGITGDEFAKLYYLKNKENYDRQDRGY